MAVHDHIIMRQVLLLQVASTEHLGEIQHQIQRSLEEELTNLLDELLTNHVPDDVIINLEQLQVDLGNLSLPSLAEEILIEVQKKLPSAIREEVEIAMQDPQKRRVIPLPIAKLKAIQHYLIHGYTAWWMPTNAQKTLEATYLELVDELPEELAKLWWELRSDPKAIQRFIAQFSPLAAKKTIQVLHGSHSRHILAITEDLVAIQQKHSPAFPRAAAFTQAVWAATLSQTIATKTVFNEQSFVQESLRKLAKELDMSYLSLLSKLAEQVTHRRQPHKFRSPLPQLVTHLHQTSTPQAETRQTSPPALMKRFNTLLVEASTKKRSAEELPALLKEILANVSPLEAQSLLMSQLQSEAHITALINNLSVPAIRQLVATLNPAIQPAFQILTTLWEVASEQERSGPLTGQRPIEQLTLRYIGLRTDDGVAQSYLDYLFDALAKQSPVTLHQLRVIMQKHKPRLLQVHAAKEVSLVIKTLRKMVTFPGISFFKEGELPLQDQEHGKRPSLQVDELLEASNVKEDQKGDEHPYLQVDEFLEISNVEKDQVQERKNSLYSRVDKFLEALHSAIPSNMYPEAKAVGQLLVPLSKALESVINMPHPDKKQANTLVRVWRELLALLIRDKVVLKDILAKAQDWVQQVVSEPDSTKRHSIVSRLEDRLVTMLEKQPPPTKPEPLSLSVVRDFFLTGTLPQGHASVATFLIAFLEEVQQGSMRESTITLLQTESVRERLVAVMPVQSLQTLTTALTPLPLGTLATYQTVLLKADILKAATLEAKQRVLSNFFLEAIGQVPTSTATQLIQRVLLSVSHYSQMPKKELFRRVRLVAKQHEQVAVMTPLLEAIDTTVDLSTAEVIDAFELALLPIYQALRELVPPSILPQYRTVLLPAMKQAIQQGTSGAELDEQVIRMVETAFQALKFDKQAEVKALIKNKLQQAAPAHQEQLGKIWRHFLRTGKVVDKQYTRPRNFLEVFLAKPPIKGPQVIEDLTKDPQGIKRLVVYLKDPTLARLVMLVNEKAHEIVLKDIHSIYTLWASTSTHQVGQQDFRHAWWEAALAQLLTYKTETFQEKPWLARSLLALAGAIGVERHALLDSLVATTKTELAGTKVEKRLGKQLQQIQKVWRREVRKKAKKADLHHPALRELHKLLEFGLAAWGEHKDSALARLEQQLQQLFAERGDAIKALLRTYPHQELVAQRLAHYFSDAIVQQFIALLAGQFYSFIQQYLTWANALKLAPRSGKPDAFTWRKYNEVAVLAYLLSNTSFDQGALIAYHLKQLSKYTGISQSALLEAMLAQALSSEMMQLLQALVRAGQLEHKEGEEQLLFQEEEAPSEEIKIYVQNGGLVFLWPFLAQLFEAQEFMQDNKFVDQVAASNAVHTLQYITTTQLHTAGWRLVLNKLLCGLAYNDVVASGYRPEQAEEPLGKDREATIDSTEEEEQTSEEVTQQKTGQQPTELLPEILHLQQTCEAILQQAMEKWEGLNALEEFEEYKGGFTLDDFRAYFLNRHGILRRIEGSEESYWHLTLPFLDYDSREIYPPWELEEIHLPWMPEKLVVFWTPE